ncbi:hypothetical protein M0R45_019179 [Rubus argutus]|uniref:MHC class I antigen n=1 Tax=Rubus argutus TaxID=59490 RepID=A0AAW1X559_RUBAR
MGLNRSMAEDRGVVWGRRGVDFVSYCRDGYHGGLIWARADFPEKLAALRSGSWARKEAAEPRVWLMKWQRHGHGEGVCEMELMSRVWIFIEMVMAESDFGLACGDWVVVNRLN